MYLFKGEDYHHLLAENKRCDLERVPNYLVISPHSAVDLFWRLVEVNPKYRLNAREAL